MNDQICLRRLNDEYKRFSKVADMPTQRERAQVAGFGKGQAANAGVLRKTVASAEKGGIIKEKSQKPITPITDNAIQRVPNVKIDGYTAEQCVLIQQQHKELLEFAKRENASNEVAFVFRKNLTGRTEHIGTDDRLELGNLLNMGDDLFVMHNHPRNSSFSDTDMRAFLGTKEVKSLSIVKNNGKIEVITKTDKFDLTILMNDFKRKYKKYVKTNSDSEIDKAISSFIKDNKEMILWNG